MTQESVRAAGSIIDAEAFANTVTEQMNMAGQVQRDFLPRQLPNYDTLRWGASFLPAEWVSGDIYDVARLDEKHIGFYVADVVGHGMPAALLTMFLKQALVMRETVGNNYRIFTPSQAMEKLNLRMTNQKLSGQRFITCCYCLLNMQTMELTYSRAGHPYPLLIRRDQKTQQLQTKGSLLGIFERAEFVEQTIKLQPADKLLLYSDGAESFIGQSDENNGFVFTREFEQLKDLPVEEMVEGFNQLVKSKKGGILQADDVTMLVLEILQRK